MDDSANSATSKDFAVEMGRTGRTSSNCSKIVTVIVFVSSVFGTFGSGKHSHRWKMADEDLMDFQTQVNDIDEKLKQISDDYNPHSNNSFAKRIQKLTITFLQLAAESKKLKNEIEKAKRPKPTQKPPNVPNNVIQISTQDETETAFSTGADVVEKTLELLKRANIFPKSHTNFLRIWAKTDTNFGQDRFTFNSSSHNGIWKISKEVFEASKDPSRFMSYYKIIEQKFGINWPLASWKDLRKPIISAIAANFQLLLIKEKEGRDGTLPGLFRHQAVFWRKFIRPDGDIRRFNVNAAMLQRKVCSGTLDLCMVLDGSGSIGHTDFKKAKTLLTKLIETFHLDRVIGTRIALVLYDQNVYDQFDFSNSFTKAQMTRLISNMSYPSGQTATGDGILRCIYHFQMASPRPGVPQVMVTFTDGVSNFGTPVKDAVKAVESVGLASYAVGIGSAFSETNLAANKELSMIAFDKPEYILKAHDYNVFLETFAELNRDFCSVLQTPRIGLMWRSAPLQPNERRYFRIPIPDEGAVRINVKSNGTISGYYSFVEKNPDSALYDGRIGRNQTSLLVQKQNMIWKDGSVRASNEIYVTVQGNPFGGSEFTLELEEVKDGAAAIKGQAIVRG